MRKPRCTPSWRAAAIVPAAVVAFMAFGSSGAYAATASPAVAHGNAGDNSQSANANANSNAGANASPNANGGVGNGNGNGNGRHDDASASAGSGAGATTTTTTTSSTPVANSAPGNSDHSSGNAGTVGDPGQPQPLSGADQNGGGANGQCSGTDNGAYCSTRGNGTGQPQASGNGNGNGKAVGKPCAGCVGKADNKNPKGQRPNGSDHNNGYECDGNHGIGRTNPAHTGCQPTTPSCSTNCNPQCPPNSHSPQCNPNCPPNSQAPQCNPQCPPGSMAPQCNPQCPPGSTSPQCNPQCPPGSTAPQCNGGGGGCDTTTTNCGGGCPPGQVMSNAGVCEKPPCVGTKANHQCGHMPPPEGCVPTQANNFCTSVEAKHHHKPTVKTPTVLGEKFTNTPETLPFTGANVGAMLGIGLLVLLFGALLLAAGTRQPGESTAARLRRVLALVDARPALAAATAGMGVAAPRRHWSRDWSATAVRRTQQLMQPRIVLRRARFRRRPRA